MQGEGRDAWGCAGMLGCTSVGWGAKYGPAACAPDAPSQPQHWGGHAMVVSLVPAGLWVLLGLPCAPSGAEILTELMEASGALCRPSRAFAALGILAAETGCSFLAGGTMEETKSLCPSNGTAWLLRPSVCWVVPSISEWLEAEVSCGNSPLDKNVISVFCWSRSSPPTGTRHHQAEPVPAMSFPGAPTFPFPWAGWVLAGSVLLPCPLGCWPHSPQAASCTSTRAGTPQGPSGLVLQWDLCGKT